MASDNKITIKAPSFGGAQNASNDLFSSSSTGLTEDVLKIATLDVLTNDKPGVSLYSLDDGRGSGGKNPDDLLKQDTARTESASSDRSFNGAKIWIENGQVKYDASTLSDDFKAKLQHLSVGEFLTDSFTYAVKGADGLLSWATATVQIAGVNDNVVITSRAQTGSVVEDGVQNAGDHDDHDDDDSDGQSGQTAHGTIKFTDADLSDKHTATATFNGSSADALGTLTLKVHEGKGDGREGDDHDGNGSARGTVEWTYTLDNAKAQHLAAGETVTETYTVTVDDGHGGSATQTVTITVTGTNDAPVAQAKTDAVNEDSTITGHVVATDVDDGAVLTYKAANGQAAVAGLTFNADGSYSFDASNAAYQHLAAGQTADVTFNYTATDEHGASSNSTLTITVTGTNDAAVFTGVDTGVVDENGSDLTTTGQLIVNDVDDNQSAIDVNFTPLNINSDLGTLTIDAQGNWTYNVLNSAVAYLNDGETKIDTFTVQSLDGTQHNINITINGDSDGVSGTLENGVPNLGLVGNTGVGDGNGDGKLDSLQLDVVSSQVGATVAGVPQEWVTLAASGGAEIQQFSNDLTATNGVTDPYGTFHYDVKLATGETSVQMTSYLTGNWQQVGSGGSYVNTDSGVVVNGAWKQDASGWHNIATSIGVVDNKLAITYTLTDGNPLTDSDSTVNGTIVDPVVDGFGTVAAPTLTLAVDSTDGAPGHDTDGITNSGVVNVGGLEAGGTWKYSTDGGNSWTAGSGTSFALSGDGVKNVIVQQADAVGNVSPSSNVLTFTLDTTITAPTVALVQDSGSNTSDGLTNNAALTFSTPDTDATRVITVDGNVVDSYDASALKDGDHTVSVTDTDAAGNVKSANVSFTLDTTLTAPTVALVQDSGSNTSDGLTNNAALTFSTPDTDATRVITVDGNVVDSYDASALKDGAHTVSVTDSDAAGNVKSANVAFTLDTTLTAPTVALVQDSGSNTSDGLTNNAALNFSTPDADATRVITVDGNVVDSYDASALKDGAHTVSVTDTDAAGNVKSANVAFTLDTTLTAPTVALVQDTGSNTSDGLTNNAALTFSTPDANATRVITVDGNVVDSYDASALKDGDHTVSVTDTDAAGNVKSANVSFTLNTSTSVSISSVSNTSAGITTSNTPTISGTSEAGDSVMVKIDAGNWVAATVDSNGNWTYAGQTALSDGNHTITAEATDAAGNVRDANANMVISTTPTENVNGASFTPDNGTSNTDMITNKAAVTVSGTLDGALGAGHSVWVSVDNGTSWQKATATVGSTTWSIGETLLSGSHTLEAEVRSDASGNHSTTWNHSYLLDTGTNLTGSISNIIDAHQSSGTLTFTATASSGVAGVGIASVVLTSPDFSNPWSMTQNANGTWSVNILDQGTNNGATRSFSIQVTDSAGNTKVSSVDLVDTGTSSSNSLVSSNADYIFGFSGNDTLQGTKTGGGQILSGGDGNDLFNYQGALNAMAHNTITDFTDNTTAINGSFTLNSLSGDVLQFGLSDLGVSASSLGLTFGEDGNKYATLKTGDLVNGTAATANHAQFLFDKSTGVLSFDADGTGHGAAVQVGIIGNHPGDLVVTDIVIHG